MKGMIIKEIFDKDINRDIKGVIKVGQTDEENIYQELNEYVVTRELNKHFKEFFQMYERSIEGPTDDMGVWISGFFGSGKSHFLKILSYILDSNLTVHGRRPIDFFTEEGKISEPKIIAEMTNATNVSSDVILFNIDAKNEGTSQGKDSILNVFMKVFNSMQGYSEETPYIAEFEKELTERNQYKDFKEEFLKINGDTWENQRDSALFIQDEIIETLSNLNIMSEESARNWIDSAEDNYNPSIENFANEVKEYIKTKGNNHHVIFLVDEIGQYIGDDTKLMLNLQTLTEELGTKCHGQAWIIVTSQEDIDSIANVKGNDFSKIQGRFKTRLSLSSSNVDEVIQKRVLAKTETADSTLKLLYEDKEATLKNLLTFDNQAEMKIYKDKENFSKIYPFIPYQFNLLQKVLNSIRTHGASGKHLAEGERSMLALFQESAQKMENENIESLIPFNMFYDALEKFIDHSHSIVINKAIDNDLLDNFDVEVLKALFLIKYVKEIKANTTNITTLMINTINADRISLNEKINKSLHRLVNQTLIQKNGDIYSFLTDEEQDINRAIKNIPIESSEILTEEGNIIFEEIIDEPKYSYSKRYNFKYNQYIDNIQRNSQIQDIGLRFVTSYYEVENTTNQKQLTQQSEEEKMDIILRELSKDKNETIFYLQNDSTLLQEIEERQQIIKYLKKRGTDADKQMKLLLSIKGQEAEEKKERIHTYLEEAVKTAKIYIAGNKADIPEKNPKERIDESLEKLVEKIYYKLNYMQTHPAKTDILKNLKEETQTSFNQGENENHNAIEDLDGYIELQANMHSTPSIKTILNKFKKAPYGFIDLDTQWLISKLYSQKRISLVKNGEIITNTNHSTDEIYKYITDNKFNEKILIEKKKTISTTKIKITKEILRDFFNSPTTTDDSDILMETFKKESKNKNQQIQTLLLEYQIPKYPGENILKQTQELLLDAQNKNSPNQFYNFITDKEDIFNELTEELDNIFNFFSGEQKNIYNKSFDTFKKYSKNQYFLNNPNIKESAKRINEILKMENPYSFIHELPSLNNIIEEGLNETLKKEREKLIPILKQDQQYLTNQLTTDELKENFMTKITRNYENLLNNLNENYDISSIRGTTDQSIQLKSNLLKQIEEYIKNHPGKGHVSPQPKTPTTKDITIENLINEPRITIENNEDIHKFLEKLKEKLEKELKETDKININL
jgi:hypothetical protein